MFAIMQELFPISTNEFNMWDAYDQNHKQSLIQEKTPPQGHMTASNTRRCHRYSRNDLVRSSFVMFLDFDYVS